MIRVSLFFLCVFSFFVFRFRFLKSRFRFRFRFRSVFSFCFVVVCFCVLCVFGCWGVSGVLYRYFGCLCFLGVFLGVVYCVCFHAFWLVARLLFGLGTARHAINCEGAKVPGGYCCQRDGGGHTRVAFVRPALVSSCCCC